MIRNQKKTAAAVSLPVGLAFGGVLSMGLSVLLSGVMAYLMGKEVLMTESVGIASVFVLVLSSAAGALLAYGKIKSQRLLVCMLSGAVYLLLLLSCTALFFGGRYQGIAATALAVLGGCGAVALMGLKGQGSSHKKLSKRFRSR